MTSVGAGRVFYPSVAADRTTIVFSAIADPLGTNADLSEEIFRIQADGSGLAQLTSSSTGESQAPRISADGQVVVFQSTADLTGSNADGSMEVFKIAANGTGLLQLTSGAAGTSNSGPRVDDTGTWVAYSANDQHIWRIQTNGTGAQRVTPAGVAAVSGPDISGSGERIVWHSNSLAGGNNPERNEEIFVYHTTTASRIQLTSTDSHQSRNPRISRDGTWVYFGSYAEFHEDDPDYPFDVQRVLADGTGAVERVGALRIMNFSSGALAVDHDGDRAVLAGPGDWAGTNPDLSSEVFLFDRSAPAAITIGKAGPTLVSWIPESGPIRYDVIRGDVANLQDGGGGTVDLGAVVCLEDDSPDADTEGFEDAINPDPGQAFFFLYRGSVGLDVGPGSFGTAKDGRVRVAGTGNCAS